MVSDEEEVAGVRDLELCFLPAVSMTKLAQWLWGLAPLGLAWAALTLGALGLELALCLAGRSCITARLLAGICRLLCPGHRGLPCRYFSRLRGRRPRAAEPDPRGQSRLDPQDSASDPPNLILSRTACSPIPY